MRSVLKIPSKCYMIDKIGPLMKPKRWSKFANFATSGQCWHKLYVRDIISLGFFKRTESNDRIGSTQVSFEPDLPKTETNSNHLGQSSWPNPYRPAGWTGLVEQNRPAIQIVRSTISTPEFICQARPIYDPMWVRLESDPFYLSTWQGWLEWVEPKLLLVEPLSYMASSGRAASLSFKLSKWAARNSLN